MKKTTTIDVTEKTKRELNKVKGGLMSKSGDSATYDDAIRFLLRRRS
ncbi:hypothetical protein ACFL6S_00670 [Candidatus Poribacteria bacterium]